MNPQHRSERAADGRRAAGDLAGAAVDAKREAEADAFVAQAIDRLRQPFAIRLGDQPEQGRIAQRAVFEEQAEDAGEFRPGDPFARCRPAGMGAGRHGEGVVAGGERDAQAGRFVRQFAGAAALAAPGDAFGDDRGGAQRQQGPGRDAAQQFADRA